MNLEQVNKQANSDEVSLGELITKIKQIYDYLLSKWLIIVIIGLLGGVLGFIYAYYKKPIYAASTTFVLEGGESKGGLGQYAGLASMVGVDIGGGGGGIFQGDNLLQLYKSRNMLQRALLATGDFDGSNELLIDRYIKVNELRENWKGKKDLQDLNFKIDLNKGKFTRLQDSVMGAIVSEINNNYISVSKPDKKLSIIKVEIKSDDEQFAKGFNDQIVKTVNEFYVQTKTKKALENLAILQHQTDSVKGELTGSIYSSAAVVDATPNLNPTRQVLRVPASKAQFNAEANKAILTQLVQNLELSKITLRNETPLIQVLDAPIYPLEVQRFGKLKGIVSGGLIFGFLIVCYLIIKRIVSQSNQTKKI